MSSMEDNDHQILIAHKDAEETQKLLEVIIKQNENNNQETMLDASLKLQNDIKESLDKLSDNVKAIEFKPNIITPDVNVPEVNIPDIKVEIPEIKLPTINIPKQPAPIVNIPEFPEQKAPIVNIDIEKTNTLLESLIEEVKKKEDFDDEAFRLEIESRLAEIKQEFESKIPTFKPSAQSIPVKVNGVEVAGKLESINLTGNGSTITTDKWGNITIETKMPIAIDLSSQCNGVAKTFTLPDFTNVLMLSGTQFPLIYKPVLDFTVLSATQIELTSDVSAPESGQTLIALVI